MADMSRFATSVTLICDTATAVLGEPLQARVNLRISHAMTFFHAGAITSDAALRVVSQEAAMRELRAAAKILNDHGKNYVSGWRPISV